MNWLAILMSVATLYDEMAKGGAKAEADKILGTVVPILQALPAVTSSGVMGTTKAPGT